MYMELEDEFGDVIGKARRGQEISTSDLAALCSLKSKEIEEIERDYVIPGLDVVELLASTLGIHSEKLKTSARKSYFPLYPSGRAFRGVLVEMLVLGTSFLMNGYIVGCSETYKGVIVDPGFDPEKILKMIESLGLEIEVVLLTHGHADHVGALSEICQATGAPALINNLDKTLLGNQSSKIEGGLSEGQVFEVGKLRFEIISSGGHTSGGVSILHDNFVFVGDALFAGSMGGTRNRTAYDEQRYAIRERILTLDENVVLYPGHGPATTVGEERLNNPFFDNLC